MPRPGGLLPRPPCPFWQRKISQEPEQTPPKLGGVPQSQAFSHPSFSNQAKLAWMSETFRIGTSPLASMVTSAGFRAGAASRAGVTARAAGSSP